MEPRAYLGAYDSADRRYTLHASAQLPQALRRWLATHVFELPQHRIRVVCPDVGGGFGTKAYYYPEIPVVLYAARLVGRPVRFTATRQESYASDTHARDFLTRARLALDAEGRMLALEFDALAGHGAYESSFNPLIAGVRFGNLATCLYRTPAAHVRVTGVYTNTTPVDAYRGVAEGQITIGERLVETAAREIGLDPAELRARNYLSPDDYPYTNPLGTPYDSGNPAAQHEALLQAADYPALREEQARAQEEGGAWRLGIGMSAFVDHAGLGGPSRGLSRESGFGTWEAGRVTVHEDGMAVVSVGTHSHGQGHEITFRQIAADALGVDIADVELRQGDTDRDAGNFGTGAMRSVATAGVAVAEAGGRVVEKGKRLAAHLLEAADEDLEYVNGRYSVVGTDRGIAFREIARMAHTGNDYPETGFELGLDEVVFHDPLGDTFPTGMHLVVLRVDIETGTVALRDYYTVDDCGLVINPLIVDGQIHGGLAQGIGQALQEQIVYDESGQAPHRLLPRLRNAPCRHDAPLPALVPSDPEPPQPARRQRGGGVRQQRPTERDRQRPGRRPPGPRGAPSRPPLHALPGVAGHRAGPFRRTRVRLRPMEAALCPRLFGIAVRCTGNWNATARHCRDSGSPSALLRSILRELVNRSRMRPAALSLQGGR